MSEEKKRISTVEELPGVGGTTAAKLKEAGYADLMQISKAMPAELEEIGGIGEGTAKKVIQAARDALNMGFVRADEVLERRKLVEKIKTGSLDFDNMLGGGVETQSITECFGKYGSGKSQLGFQLCVNVQLPPEKGGMSGGALFIDTENTFRPERIAQMAQAAGLDPETVLKNIHVARAQNSDHQMMLLEKAGDLIKKGNIKLIVIDSLTSAFRNDYIGRGTLADRQGKLNTHLHTLQNYSETYNLVVYVTNQVMDRPDILFGDPTVPVGGNIVGHQCTYRVYLRRSKETRRIAKIVDSPSLPDGECVFSCEADGIKDMA